MKEAMCSTQQSEEGLNTGAGQILRGFIGTGHGCLDSLRHARMKVVHGIVGGRRADSRMVGR